MSQTAIVPAAVLPLFKELKPHLMAGHELIPLKPLSAEPFHAGWLTETP